MKNIFDNRKIDMRKSRWPKHKVVKWLELGAIPALIGLWIPNWIEGYIRLFSFGTSEGIFTATFPPVITYIGVLILFKASTEGIKNMGIHYKRAVLSGIISVILAVLSVVTHFKKSSGIWCNNSFNYRLCCVFFTTFSLEHPGKSCRNISRKPHTQNQGYCLAEQHYCISMLDSCHCFGQFQ
jgi:hypothetical protein